MKKLKVYDVGKKNLLYELNVKNAYDGSFYFRNMPTISARKCTKILNELYPHFKNNDVTLVFEWVENGYSGIQKLNRNGTILNF